MFNSVQFNMFKDTHRERSTLKLNSIAYGIYKYGHLGRWYIKLILFKRFKIFEHPTKTKRKIYKKY